MQCRKNVVPIFTPSSSASLQTCTRRRTVASSRVEGTPQKRYHRSSPEQMNSDSDECPGGSYSPMVLCAQAMGRAWLGSARHDMLPACLPCHAHAHGPTRPAAVAHAHVASFCPLLNFSIEMEQSAAYKLSQATPIVMPVLFVLNQRDIRIISH
jgi:hypothetical protein